MNRRRRVLFLSAETYPPQYGALDGIFNRGLARRGVDCVWIMPGAVDELTRESWHGHPVWLVPKRAAATASALPAQYAASVRLLAQAVNLADGLAGPIDLVQVRDDPAMAFVAHRYARRVRIPFAYQVSHLKEEECILAAVRDLYPGRLKHFAQGGVGFVARQGLLSRADVVFPISDEMARWLSQCGIAAAKMVAVPEGVDPPRFTTGAVESRAATRARLGLGAAETALVYVGTLSRMRRLEQLIWAVAALRNRGVAVRLVIAGGDAQPGDTAFLRSTATGAGVADRVVFTGFVVPERVPQLIAACDIGISAIPDTFVYRHSSPIKILEYMALGMPVVATDIPSQRQVLGRLCPENLVSHRACALADAVTRLMGTDPAKRRQAVAAGRDWVLRHRSYDVLAGRVAASYRRLWGDESVGAEAG
ncbi:MAG: glycosyltransferase family 4 protein [Myxococcales bacterium FL481]|nr:MAG: glycosyltransferase family 4 protein [Myxococcales bacterium FL481]